MGYCTGNLCAHRSGASMNHIHHATLLRRAALMRLTSESKIMSSSPSTSRLRTLSLSLRQNSLETGTVQSMHTYMITCCLGKAFCKAITDKAALGMHATRHGPDKWHGLLSWRVFSSMIDGSGSNILIHREQSMCEDLTTPSGGPLKARKCVVVVESPTKAKTIEKYLGPDYVVLPTYGHVRDLAARAGSVRPDQDYSMLWEVPEAAHTHISRIKQALKGAECLILASDPDREGEAIAWHVTELLKAEGVLKGRNPKVVRVTFHEITKDSVLRAMQDPRDICITLVTAYLARRALDHLIGFALSPVLWRKLPGSRSAGRVQSVALKLVCEREREIEEFVPQEFWTVEAYARLDKDSEEHSLFPIRPTHIDGRSIEKFSFGSVDAKSLSERLSNQPLKVSSVQRRSKRRNPPLPYITSSLQMDAQTKLGYGAVRTMTLAQKLYEGVKLEDEQLTGLITYMRTDGLQLSSEAVKGIRALAGQRYGDKYVPIERRQFNSKVKNAQEAHEAIRPTDVYRLPSQLVHLLEKDALLLYTLIWKRTVACQMEQAVYEEAVVNFVTDDGSICLQAGGSILSFPGFLAALEDNHGMKSTAEDVVEGDTVHEDIEVGKHTYVFSLKKDDVVVVQKAEAQQHFTRPPARFSEGLLVKAMEGLGIGRPSTYATMLKTLESRSYVEIEHHRITPKPRGRMVATFLSHYFPKYIDYDFTAHLEEQLDEVSGGRVEWKQVLRGFWPDFESVVATSMKVKVQEVIEMLQGALSSHCFKGLGISGHTCPSCEQGKLMLKLSRYGSGYFFGCDRYPDCCFKAQLLNSEHANVENEDDMNVSLRMIQNSDVLLGLDPDTNFEVRVRKGPFGYYIQSGEQGKQIRNFKIPQEVSPSDLTLEKAKELMKFPLELGKHPEDGQPIILCIGRTSYYVKHRNALASVPKGEAPHELTLERAFQLLKSKKVRYTGGKAPAVHAEEERNRILQQQKGGRRAAVSRLEKVVKSGTKKVEDDDPKAKKAANVGSTDDVEGETKLKRIRKSMSVKTECKGDDLKESTGDVEGETKLKTIRKPTVKNKRKDDDLKATKLSSAEVEEGELQLETIRKQRIPKAENDKGGPKAKKVRKVGSTEVVQDEGQAKKINNKRTVEVEGEPTAKNVTKQSPDNHDGEPKAKRLIHGKSNEPVVTGKKVKKYAVKLTSDVKFEADATVKNESVETVKGKSRKKKAQLTAESQEDELNENMIRKKVVKIEKNQTSQAIAKQGNGSFEEIKPKAKRLPHQKENDSIAANEKVKIAGDKEVSIESSETGYRKVGRKKVNAAVDENVQKDSKTKEPGLQSKVDMSSNGRIKMSTRGKTK